LGISASGQGDQVLVCQKQVLSFLTHHHKYYDNQRSPDHRLVQVLSVAAALRELT
jgi:hypothetical protein